MSYLRIRGQGLTGRAYAVASEISLVALDAYSEVLTPSSVDAVLAAAAAALVNGPVCETAQRDGVPAPRPVGPPTQAQQLKAAI